MTMPTLNFLGLVEIDWRQIMVGFLGMAAAVLSRCVLAAISFFGEQILIHHIAGLVSLTVVFFLLLL